MGPHWPGTQPQWIRLQEQVPTLLDMICKFGQLKSFLGGECWSAGELPSLATPPIEAKLHLLWPHPPLKQHGLLSIFKHNPSGMVKVHNMSHRPRFTKVHRLMLRSRISHRTLLNRFCQVLILAVRLPTRGTPRRSSTLRLSEPPCLTPALWLLRPILTLITIRRCIRLDLVLLNRRNSAFRPLIPDLVHTVPPTTCISNMMAVPPQRVMGMSAVIRRRPESLR